MENVFETLNTLSFLSSGTGEGEDRVDTLPSLIFGFLDHSADWASAVSKLIGLL